LTLHDMNGGNTTLGGVAVGTGKTYAAGTLVNASGLQQWLAVSVSTDLSTVNWMVSGNHTNVTGDIGTGCSLTADGSTLYIGGTGYGSTVTMDNSDQETLWFVDLGNNPPTLVHDYIWYFGAGVADTTGTGIVIDSAGKMDTSGVLKGSLAGMDIGPAVSQLDGVAGTGSTSYFTGSSDPNNSMNGVAIDASNNIFASGRIFTSSTNHVDLLMASYDSGLGFKWGYSYHFTLNNLDTDSIGNSIQSTPGDFGGIPLFAGTITDPGSGNTLALTGEATIDGSAITDSGALGVTGDNLVGNGIGLDSSMSGNNAFVVGADTTMGDGFAASVSYS
jgi:hypothetical protein